MLVLMSVNSRDWVVDPEDQIAAQGEHMVNLAYFWVTAHPGEATSVNRSCWVVTVKDHLAPLGEDKASWAHWVVARHLVAVVAMLANAMDCLEAGVNPLAKSGVDRANRRCSQANQRQVVTDLG